MAGQRLGLSKGAIAPLFRIRCWGLFYWNSCCSNYCKMEATQRATSLPASPAQVRTDTQVPATGRSAARFTVPQPHPLRKADLPLCLRPRASGLVLDLHGPGQQAGGTHPQGVGRRGPAACGSGPGVSGGPQGSAGGQRRTAGAVAETATPVSGPSALKILRYASHCLGLKSYLQHPGDGRIRPRIPAQALVWSLLIAHLLRAWSFLVWSGWCIPRLVLAWGSGRRLAMTPWPISPSG